MAGALTMALVRAMPRSLVSRAVGAATRAPLPPPVHHLAIRAFASRYRVALDEADGRVEQFRTFSDFFCRPLKGGLRPIETDPGALISPVDGAVSECGAIENGRLIQAKGIDFPVEQLLGDAAQAERFVGGTFATLYLSPRDYHRIHSPIDGQIDGYTYIPGEFWPVNEASVASVHGVFALNERLVTWMSGRCGAVALVAVGATCVGRIRAAYDEILTHSNMVATSFRYPKPLPISRGAEVARFEMGSTVILLFEKGRVTFDGELKPTAPVRMGRRIGAFR